MIKGTYFNGKTSARSEVVLSYDDAGQIQIQGVTYSPVSANELTISSRIGNTPRYISLPDGGQFETDDNNAIDKMIAELGLSKSRFSIHKLESAKRFVATTVVVVVVFAWVFVQYGIPLFAKQVAFALPQQASARLGDGVLENMDKHIFKKSTLSKSKQKQLRRTFSKLVSKIENPPALKLEFRDGGYVGANAFALPDGTIVMTDQFVKLTKNRHEIGSVMLHEIGHVQERHSLRLATQSFGLAMFVMVLTGDVSTSSSIISAIPVVLVESGYSQGMEWEADGYALDYMQAHNIDPIHFANMMQKLEQSHIKVEKWNKANKKSKGDKGCETSSDKNKQGGDGSIIDYFSSHPATAERIKRFKDASQSIKKRSGSV
ncbi:MAG: M48 family metallopeptidase [Proteobacteria bacterium]|nr:M48 family metallopeptidase [Pseudomonadota bacterium]